ncbi:CASP-like protein 4A1 [Schistocerca piceifrons]|uniref:CASP-like protein 4A1 n=1 Tax=Schistocerca piceifrons TaxID=274613 RepID=UPI001F5EF989|nr:CASP-like protein 4A1 [Schistocerca piceifrons]
MLLQPAACFRWLPPQRAVLRRPRSGGGSECRRYGKDGGPCRARARRFLIAQRLRQQPAAQPALIAARQPAPPPLPPPPRPLSPARIHLPALPCPCPINAYSRSHPRRAQLPAPTAQSPRRRTPNYTACIARGRPSA